MLGQNEEARLGERPHADCARYGGLPQPTRVGSFAYDAAKGTLKAEAEGAVAVGYALIAPGADRSRDSGLGLGERPEFEVRFKASDFGPRLGPDKGTAWIGAAVCLADNVPVRGSLLLRGYDYGGRVSGPKPVTAPAALRDRIAQLACNSGK